MHTIYLPQVHTRQIKSLWKLFSVWGIRFGFAAEGYMFDNEASGKLIREHASVITCEVSGKMEYTQPANGVYEFGMVDELYEKCYESGIQMFAHTGMWHMANPEWLWETLYGMEVADRYQWLGEYLGVYCRHFKGKVYGMDLINEIGMVSKDTAWWDTHGENVVEYAYRTAREIVNGMYPLYYNSFFDKWEDVELADWLVESGLADGIGVQLHLHLTCGYQDRFNTVRHLAETCRKHDKPVRISEVSVNDPESTWDMEAIGNVYRDTVRLAKELSDVVTDYVVWGVKYPAWNGRHVLFDREGKPTHAYWAVYDEIQRGI